MLVNSSTAHTPQVNQNVSIESQNRVSKESEQLIVREQQQKSAERENSNDQQQRFDVDEQAIALVEQEQQRLSAQNEPTTSNEQAQYDQPSQRHQVAVSAYQAINNQQQQEIISKSFGVDLYA
ncbi:hypothetical protein [Thalassotalea hakodatensis]|uniref:hypothetical protein n=1 Tax=Thalassotalea hakodatensis TaxID=3030492 RepID=UPI0025722502|nr:hypothetical protein [Thalassotalea hakodatensis]